MILEERNKVFTDKQVEILLVDIFRQIYNNPNIVFNTSSNNAEEIIAKQKLFDEIKERTKSHLGFLMENHREENKNSLQWIDVKDQLPEKNVEVLVEVNGHRSPSWRNNYNVVAYLTDGGMWVEERHGWEPLSVLYWAYIPPAPVRHK